MFKKLKKTAKTRYQELLGYSAYLFRKNKKNQTKIILFGQGRTGSTVLESLLGSTGYIQGHGEIFDRDGQAVLMPAKFIIGHARRFNKNFLFHCKIYHLNKTGGENNRAGSFLKKLQKDGWKIVYLKRENFLLQVISNFISNERKKFHKLNDDPEYFHFEIDIDEFNANVALRLSYLEQEKKALAQVDHIELTYENDIEKAVFHQQAVDKILKFAAIQNDVPVSTNFRKVNTQKLEAILINYDAFKTNVEANGWGHLLSH